MRNKSEKLHAFFFFRWLERCALNAEVASAIPTWVIELRPLQLTL